LTIDSANICSSVQDHRSSVISYKGSGRTNKEQKKLYLKLKALLKSMTSSEAEGPQKLQYFTRSNLIQVFMDLVLYFGAKVLKKW